MMDKVNRALAKFMLLQATGRIWILMRFTVSPPASVMQGIPTSRITNIPELATKKAKKTLRLQNTEDLCCVYDKDRLSRCQIWAAIMIKIAIENPDGTLQVQCLCTVGLVEFWKLDKIQQIFILIPNMNQHMEPSVLLVGHLCPSSFEWRRSN